MVDRPRPREPELPASLITVRNYVGASPLAERPFTFDVNAERLTALATRDVLIHHERPRELEIGYLGATYDFSLAQCQAHFYENAVRMPCAVNVDILWAHTLENMLTPSILGHNEPVSDDDLMQNMQVNLALSSGLAIGMSVIRTPSHIAHHGAFTKPEWRTRLIEERLLDPRIMSEWRDIFSMSMVD